MTFRKAAGTAIAAVFAVAVMGFNSYAAGDFEGMWQVTDSKGKPFQITLGADGKATGTERPNQSGTWKQQGSAAVISWNTGWTTKIEKADDHYTHTGYRPGQSLRAQPASTSDAEKLRLKQ
jgi:hypothetical protein